MKATGLLLTLLIGATASASADTLLMDAVSKAPPNAASGLPRPRTGQSMVDVKARFGEPQAVKDAVGEPPITRWVYPSYTVYFEHDRVIESVVHR